MYTLPSTMEDVKIALWAVVNHILGTLDGMVQLKTTLRNPCTGLDHATLKLVWIRFEFKKNNSIVKNILV